MNSKKSNTHLICHSRESGNPLLQILTSSWIPAFAGMTTFFEVVIFAHLPLRQKTINDERAVFRKKASPFRIHPLRKLLLRHDCCRPAEQHISPHV